MATKRGEDLYLVLDVIAFGWSVDEPNVVGIHGIELEEVIVHSKEGPMYVGPVCVGAVREHGDPGFRRVLVTQVNRRIDDLGKDGACCRLAISRESDDIR